MCFDAAASDIRYGAASSPTVCSPLREPLEHRPPGVVAEGAEDEVESVLMLNHMVEYDTGGLDCQLFG